MSILGLLAPAFILIALGDALGRAFGYRDEFWVGLEKVVYATSHASAFQCAFRFNSYVGFAVLGRLHGDAGIAAMAILQRLWLWLISR